MQYVTEYRQSEDARRIAQQIAQEVHPDRQYRFMEFCGGHTHVLSRWGLMDLMPKNLRMIHGPGCPVCVLPIGRIDMAMKLAQEQNVILCTYADTMRVPAGHVALQSESPRCRHPHDLLPHGCAQSGSRESRPSGGVLCDRL